MNKKVNSSAPKKRNKLTDIKEADKQKHKKSKKILKGIAEWLIYVLIFILIVWGTPKALAKILNINHPIAAITSSSMWPALKEGDIVLIRGVNYITEINPGDIVVYENQKGFTIHRVVRIYDDQVITKGDANNQEDSPISFNIVIGKTINLGHKPLRIPYLGKLSQIFN
jgi:signal peptidase